MVQKLCADKKWLILSLCGIDLILLSGLAAIVPANVWEDPIQFVQQIHEQQQLDMREALAQKQLCQAGVWHGEACK